MPPPHICHALQVRASVNAVAKKHAEIQQCNHDEGMLLNQLEKKRKQRLALEAEQTANIAEAKRDAEALPDGEEVPPAAHRAHSNSAPSCRRTPSPLSRLPPAQHEKHRLTARFVQAESLTQTPRKKQSGAPKAAPSKGDGNARATASLRPPPPTFQFPQPSLQPAPPRPALKKERTADRARARLRGQVLGRGSGSKLYDGTSAKQLTEEREERNRTRPRDFGKKPKARKGLEMKTLSDLPCSDVSERSLTESPTPLSAPAL